MKLVIKEIQESLDDSNRGEILRDGLKISIIVKCFFEFFILLIIILKGEAKFRQKHIVELLGQTGCSYCKFDPWND